MDTENMSTEELLAREISQELSVLASALMGVSVRNNPTAALDEFRSALKQTDTGRDELVNWDLAKMSVEPFDRDGDGVVLSIKELVEQSAFYTRLVTRIVPRDADDLSQGVLEGDHYLMGFLRVLRPVLHAVGVAVGMRELRLFTEDFLHTLVDMAVEKGVLAPTSEDEVEYELVPDSRAVDGPVGPMGVTREEFIAGDFPYAADVYDGVMGAVAAADRCVIG